MYRCLEYVTSFDILRIKNRATLNRYLDTIGQSHKTQFTIADIHELAKLQAFLGADFGRHSHSQFAALKQHGLVDQAFAKFSINVQFSTIQTIRYDYGQETPFAQG
ncbi:hypothetical protein [Spirulina major]|uniref:hypothetical protein n=1 Tax=Spirulina major TaxID=270636 RepID=UPI000932A772|nr:hypothetical protein [Spirulina major]